MEILQFQIQLFLWDIRYLSIYLKQLEYAPEILEKFANVEMCDIDVSFKLRLLISNLSRPGLLKDVEKDVYWALSVLNFRN